jgi:hypothetical protein
MPFHTGVADANAARNNIAKDYMKKCDCIWILAPITRAVDDKTARGNVLSHYSKKVGTQMQLFKIFLETPSKCN